MMVNRNFTFMIFIGAYIFGWSGALHSQSAGPQPYGPFPSYVSGTALQNTPIVYATAPQYGISGTDILTTGTIAANSNVLLLPTTASFIGSEGIAVYGAGAAFSLPQPSVLSAAQQGTTGATSYTYALASLDANGGIGVPVTTSIANGNAALQSYANRVIISFTPGAGAAGTVIWKQTGAGAYTYIGVSSGGATSYNDTGYIPNWKPEFIPATPNGAALNDWLLTTISAGIGTNTLTLASKATTSVSGAIVRNDASQGMNQIIATHLSGVSIEMPCGHYNFFNTIAITQPQQGFEGQGECSVLNTYGAHDAVTFTGLITGQIRGNFVNKFYVSAQNQATGNWINAIYTLQFTSENIAIDFPPSAYHFMNFNDLRMSHIRVTQFWGQNGYLLEANTDNTNSALSVFLYDVYGQGNSTRTPTADYDIDKTGYLFDGNISTVFGFSAAVSDVPGRGFQITNNIGNAATPHYFQMYGCSSEFSNNNAILMGAGSDFFFAGCTLHGAGTPGNLVNNLEINNGVEHVAYSGGNTQNASCAGIDINGQDVQIQGVDVYNNSAPNRGGTTGQCAGISVGGTAARVTITGNAIYSGFNGTGWVQNSPIFISSPATNFTITGNVSKNNATDYIVNNVALTTTEIVANNSQAISFTPVQTGTCALQSIVGGLDGMGFMQGKFSANGLCSTGTIILSMPTAANGWQCKFSDITTVADTLNQSATTAASVTVGSATMAASDVVQFFCSRY